MNTENINKVANAIEQHSIPDLGFNMGTFRSTGEYPDMSGRNCKTVACIAGTIEALCERDGVEFEGTAPYFDVPDDAVITRLLMPPKWRTDPNRYSPAQAVAVLRRFAATGEVDWSVADRAIITAQGDKT